MNQKLPNKRWTSRNGIPDEKAVDEVVNGWFSRCVDEKAPSSEPCWSTAHNGKPGEQCGNSRRIKADKKYDETSQLIHDCQ
jgi:hypothetical protein